MSGKTLDDLFNVAYQSKDFDFMNVVIDRYKEYHLNILKDANYSEESFNQLLSYKYPHYVLFYYDAFIDSLNSKPEAWITLSKCLMKKDPKVNEYYILNMLKNVEAQAAKENKYNFIVRAKIILSKMNSEQLLLLLDDVYRTKMAMKVGQIAIETLIESKITTITERIKYAMKADCVSVVKHYFNDKNIILTANDISELLLQASENGEIEVVNLILKSVKPDQMPKINFKTAIEKAKGETIKNKLVKSQYLAGLLKQFTPVTASTPVSIANLLASKDAISFLFDKDIFSDNLFNIIMANAQSSYVFLQCLLTSHGTIKSAKAVNDKVNETNIKMGQPYISRLLEIKENQFASRAKFNEISQMVENAIYDLNFVLKLLNANCSKKDGKYYIQDPDAVKSMIDRLKLQTMSSVDKINKAIDLELVNIVGFYLQEGKLSSQELISFLKTAIAKNNLNLLKIILEDSATKQGIYITMEINVPNLCGEAKSANVDVAIVDELNKHLQTQQSIFTLPSNSSTNAQQPDNKPLPPDGGCDNIDPKILQDNTLRK
jgi:hypothetical protein